jgi:tRNA-dihydrouridine synthase A
VTDRISYNFARGSTILKKIVWKSGRIQYPVRQFCVAPMMGCTDRHFRYLLRLISRHALLYSEMITSGALLNGDNARFLKYDPVEHPVALQLGGNVPSEMAQCARLAQAFDYDEVNINVGCPSGRVQSGQFGACLMAKPDLVAQCVDAMCQAVDIPVTVKTRVGIDHQDSYPFLKRFVSRVYDAGCQVFIVHARKAWLSGLNPKQNRKAPPLQYEVVYRLKRDFPNLVIILNGGLKSPQEALAQLKQVDGVMGGRSVYNNPYMFVEVDRLFYHDDHPCPSRQEVLEAYLPYVESQLKQGVRLSAVTRHVMGLFQSLPGSRRWRREISEATHKPGEDPNVLRQAARYLGACQTQDGLTGEKPDLDRFPDSLH